MEINLTLYSNFSLLNSIFANVLLVDTGIEVKFYFWCYNLLVVATIIISGVWLKQSG
jgi:hypothetical protein